MDMERFRQSRINEGSDWRARLSRRELRPPVSSRPLESTRHGGIHELFADPESIAAERLGESLEETAGTREPMPTLELPENLFLSSSEVGRDLLMQRADEVVADLDHMRRERKRKLREKGHLEIANLGPLNELIDQKKEELAQIGAQVEAGGHALDFSFLDELDDPEQREIDRHLEKIIDEHVRTAAELNRVEKIIEDLQDKQGSSDDSSETVEGQLQDLLIRQAELRRILLELDQAIEAVREGESLPMLASGLEVEPEETDVLFENEPEVADPSVEYARTEAELAILDREIDDAVTGTDRQVLEELLRKWYMLGSRMDDLRHSLREVEEISEPTGLHEDLSMASIEMSPRGEMREIVTKTRELREARSRLSDAKTDIIDAEIRDLVWSLIPALLDWREAKRDIIRLEQELSDLEHIGSVIDIEKPTTASSEVNEQDPWEQILDADVVDEEGEPLAEIEDEIDELEAGAVPPDMHIEGEDALRMDDTERAFFDTPERDTE